MVLLILVVVAITFMVTFTLTKFNQWKDKND
jgi:hypothetical protein